MTADTEGRARDVDVVGRVHSTESFGTVDGPGTRFVVFCQGCPMRCQYCHNPDTWEFARADGTGPGTSASVGELLERFERNRPFYRKGGITVTGGEPMAQPDFVAALFRAAHEAPAGRIHTCLDTSAATFSAERAGRFSALLDATDMVLLDIKTSDATLHERLCGMPASHALELGDELARRGIPTLVRHVVVPGLTDSEEECAGVGRIIGDWDNVVGLDFLPYHTLGRSKYEKLGIPYPLEGVKAMEAARAKELRRVALAARARRRAERGKR
ncbi:pyruvate formate-lyase-activating protein [Olsenella sp. An290]|uniref:pyruvate formate-lyase-activating protein n=1 Tax=Olsenella sp. An290 TaxID=1965625 RepID=UPI001EF5B4BE|nr:pyruvate formate-lyase-activating protein [Olsenella sp. An290]